MKLAEFCLKHRVTTIMAYVMVVIFGVMGFFSLPLALMPNIEMPMAVVYATYSGAGPEEVENMVTRTLESACARVAGMEELQSTSSEGMSMVMVSFADGTDMDEALVSLREKIDQVKSYLPDDASAPTVMSIDVDAMPVLQVGLRGADLAQLQTIAEDTISPALERIDGVASVDIMGGYETEVAIDTYADRLAGYNLSVSYVAQILGAENIALPAGNVSNGTKTLTARTDGEFSSLDDIKNTLIPLPAGGSVRLGEIANVRLQPAEQTEIAKIGTQECIVLSVNKQSDVNTVQVANKVNAALDTLKQDNPTLDTLVVFDQSEQINMTVQSVIQNILLGVLLAAVVLFAFLRDPGATGVISVAMPVCIIAVFLVMKALNITMNIMSLGGLAMGVGMIVDNSIVVLENIFRYRSDGCERWQSCVEGTAEVALSISASTLTTIAVFLPIGLSGGIVGMMFKEFSLTISALLLASLLIALTLVPLLSYMLLDRNEKKHRLSANPHGDIADRPIMRKYKKGLEYFITHRKVAMLTTLGLIVLFTASIATAGVEMIPSMDQGMVQVTIGTPVGAEMEEKAAFADRVTDIAVETIPEIESLYYTTGSSSSMMSSAGTTSVSINLVPGKERDRSSEEIADQLRKDLNNVAGCEISVSSTGSMDMSSMTGSAISVTLTGNDYEELTDTGNRLVRSLSEIPDAIEVKSSASEEVPQVNITLNRENASRFGLTAATIGQAVRGQLAGTTATTLKMKGEEITVSVKGDARIAQSLDALRTVSIPTQAGGSVPLELVANVGTELAPQTIARKNQTRTITITGDSISGDATAMAASVQQVLADFELPDGVSFDQGGEMEEMIESFKTLGYALIVSIGLIYFVLASQFESFVMPIIIMMILPVGLIGSLFGLPITGNKISIIAFIGVIMLAGTIVNSAIVLIDYINTRRGRGEDKNTAILNACPRRVRPVLMTTLTTVLGLLPMALSNGEGAEMMRPMAIVMITGMIIATIVTLVFTPVYYSLVDSMIERFKNRKNKPKKERKQKRKEKIKE